MLFTNFSHTLNLTTSFVRLFPHCDQASFVQVWASLLACKILQWSSSCFPRCGLAIILTFFSVIEQVLTGNRSPQLSDNLSFWKSPHFQGLHAESLKASGKSLLRESKHSYALDLATLVQPFPSLWSGDHIDILKTHSAWSANFSCVSLKFVLFLRAIAQLFLHCYQANLNILLTRWNIATLLILNRSCMIFFHTASVREREKENDL
jgi:hypothetical protein